MRSSNQGAEKMPHDQPAQQSLDQISSLLNIENSHLDAHNLPTFSSQLLKITRSERPEAVYKEETFLLEKTYHQPELHSQTQNVFPSFLTVMLSSWNDTLLSGNLDLKY